MRVCWMKMTSMTGKNIIQIRLIEFSLGFGNIFAGTIVPDKTKKHSRIIRDRAFRCIKVLCWYAYNRAYMHACCTVYWVQ